MKLGFVVREGVIVPVDVETGEGLEDVVSASVDCKMAELVTLTVTVYASKKNEMGIGPYRAMGSVVEGAEA